MNQASSLYLYRGGLAEIVSRPTNLTYSFLLHWFSGNGSLGNAWKLLHIPYKPLNRSVITRIDSELYMDLKTEEALLYSDTILTYLPLPVGESTPTLSISKQKLLRPFSIFTTCRLVLQQSLWIANMIQTKEMAESLLNTIPEFPVHKLSLQSIDTILTSNVLPPALAINYLHEYFHALLMNKAGSNHEHILSYLYQEVRKRDWLFQSMNDQRMVVAKKLSFEEYMARYGMRSDDDYELTLPRWHEMTEEIQKRINAAPLEKSLPVIPPPTTNRQLVNVVIEFSLLRSESRRKILPWINELRQLLRTKIPDTEQLGRSSRIDVGLPEYIPIPNEPDVHITKPMHTATSGIGVSPGVVEGKIKHIRHSTDTIPESCVAIFPNASPTFASLYTKCAGILFLSGGKTSHGVIVAREYGIPAVIHTGLDIPDDAHVRLDGNKGTVSFI